MLTPLKLARLQRGLRQMDVALKLGISPARISFFETGLMQPPDDIKKQLSELLDCPMSELFPERSVGKDEGVHNILEEGGNHAG